MTSFTDLRVDGDRLWKRLEALGQIGPAAVAAVPALITALRDYNSDARSSAARALGVIGPVAPNVVPALITALGDEDSDVQLGAVGALGKICPDAADAVPNLITALGDKDSNVRSKAAEALERIGQAALRALITALSDVRWHVRWGAAGALLRPASGASSFSSTLLQSRTQLSQMYTPGPWMSFLTSECDLPQNEQRVMLVGRAMRAGR